jgi:hypothetical protein
MRKLRCVPELARVPAIALTGYAREEDRELSIKAGFNAQPARLPEQRDQSAFLIITRCDINEPGMDRRARQEAGHNSFYAPDAEGQALSRTEAQAQIGVRAIADAAEIIRLNR